MAEDKRGPGGPRKFNLQLQLDDDTAQGQYFNFAIVNHTPTEFLLDFVFVQPQQPKGKVLSRMLTSPVHAKRLLMALNENVSKYEQKFGPIKLPAAKATEPVVH